MKWLGHEIAEDGTKLNNEKLKRILKLKNPENRKQLKSFLGAIQYLVKFPPRLSERTDRLRQLLKQNIEWKREEEQERDFATIKKMLPEEPGLAHYAKDKENKVTDASKASLGITLWQMQVNGELEPIAFMSRFLNDIEKKLFNRRIKTSSNCLAIRKIPILFIGRKVYLYADHQALEPLNKRNRSRNSTAQE